MPPEDPWDSIMEEKTPKDLLKIILKRGGLSSDAAAEALGVERSTVDEWAAALAAKKYIEYASADSGNRTLRFTAEFQQTLNRLHPKQDVTSAQETKIAKLSEELREVRKSNEALTEQVREKSALIESLNADLSQEKNLRSKFQVEFERQSRQEKEQSLKSTENLQRMLSREHSERLKLEDIIRRMREGEVDSSAPEVTSVLEESAKVTKEESIEEAIAPKAEPHLVQEPNALPLEESYSSAQSSPTVQQKESSQAKFGLDDEPLDEAEALLKMLAEKKTVTVKGASSQLKIDEKTFAKIVERLIKDGLLETQWRLIGGSQLRLRGGVDVERKIQEIEASKVKRELSLMGRR